MICQKGRLGTGASALSIPRAGWLVLATVAVLTSATAPLGASQSWTTDPDFEIGGFGRVGSVRVGHDGLRIHVVEPLARRITVWSPGGQLLVRLEGEGEGPLSALGRPWDVRLLPDGFWATYDRHFVRFSDDGDVLQMLEYSLWGAETVLGDHSILARARLPQSAVMMGWMESEPPQHQAVLHYAGTGSYWAADTVAMLDVRHMTLGIRFDDGSSPFPEALFTTQPFSDADLRYFDGDKGSVGIVQRNGAPGEVVVTEITARGDTVWGRTLALPSVPIGADQIEDTVQHLASRAAASAQRLGRPISAASALRLAEQALYVPESLPAVTEVRATASGELWLRSAEKSDTLKVWYTVPRGDDVTAPRRVLLPTWFELRDATETHVWGLRSDAEHGLRVVGRRLVP